MLFLQSSSLQRRVWVRGGGWNNLHKAKGGPQSRTALAEAPEPGSWHNNPIIIFRLDIPGETEIQHNTVKNKCTQNNSVAEK